jgi:hypothetical protein
MKISPSILAGSVLVFAQIGVTAKGFDLDGAWTSQADICKNIFMRTGKATSFRPDAETYGGGFIIEGNSIRGQAAQCIIKARKEIGDVMHLVAVCSTGIMIDQMQMSFKVHDQNKLARIFPGMEDLETLYVRCPLTE